MIFLFTSRKCTWCDVVRKMLEEEFEYLSHQFPVYEVDIERNQRIAEAYGVVVVPTLVAGSHSLSGLPSASDLRAFLMQSFPDLSSAHEPLHKPKALRKMQELLASQRVDVTQELTPHKS